MGELDLFVSVSRAMTPAIPWNIEEVFVLGCRKYVRATGLEILASTVPLGYLVLLLLPYSGVAVTLYRPCIVAPDSLIQRDK